MAHWPGKRRTGRRQPKARTLTTAVRTQASARPRGRAKKRGQGGEAEGLGELDEGEAAAGDADGPDRGEAGEAGVGEGEEAGEERDAGDGEGEGVERDGDGEGLLEDARARPSFRPRWSVAARARGKAARRSARRRGDGGGVGADGEAAAVEVGEAGGEGVGRRASTWASALP